MEIIYKLFRFHSDKGLSNKKTHVVRGGEEFIQCRHFSDKGKGVSSDADVRTFWCKNIRTF